MSRKEKYRIYSETILGQKLIRSIDVAGEALMFKKWHEKTMDFWEIIKRS